MSNRPKQRIPFTEINLANMKDFYEEIIEIKIASDISTLESIIHYCESRNIDIEEVIPIIPDSLKSMIESEEIKKGTLKVTKEYQIRTDLL